MCIHNMPTCCLAKLGNLLRGNKRLGIKIPCRFDGQSYQEPCQIYRNPKIWFNEPMSKKQHQPVLVHHAAEKVQNAIKSFPTFLSHGDQSGQKRKNNSHPGRPEENAVNQSSQEQKPQRTQPKPTRWTNFNSTSTSTTSTTTTTSSSRKESTPQSVGPSAKNHHPCQKGKQTRI